MGSEYPLFMMGDYNNVNKKPAAVFGDRLYVLSNDWEDDENQQGDPMRRADATEQFFSVITGEGEGYIGCYHHGPDPGCTPTPPGRGPANTVMMLEDWRNGCSNRCLHRMIGSFVTFWAPQISSKWGNYPNPGQKYKAPRRDWSFDFDLMDPENLPPGTPNVGYVLRSSFRETI